MKNNIKIGMYLLSLIIFSAIVIGVPSNVRVVNFHYENINGEESITVTNSGTVLGYYPDYNFQPDAGYVLKVLDNNNNALFSVKMLPPSEIYVHEYNGKNITGGLVIVNQTDFSMTLPTFQNESKIVILNNDNQNVMEYKIPKQNQNSAENSKGSAPYGLILAFALIFLVFVLAVRLRKKRKEFR